MPMMRFVKDGWGHKAGEVVEKSVEDARVLIEEGVAVDNAAAPKVERAVAAAPETKTAALKR